MNQLKENNNLKSIHVIVFDEIDNKVILGRGHDSDVRVNDISVSRVHASLIYSNGSIALRDLKSKFGTLVLLKSGIEIKEQKICLQIGRTYAEASLMTYVDYQKLKLKLVY
jgi:pSer/pThr/pTyr-binding forkhead associated (FHA) protein